MGNRRKKERLETEEEEPVDYLSRELDQLCDHEVLSLEAERALIQDVVALREGLHRAIIAYQQQEEGAREGITGQKLNVAMMISLYREIKARDGTSSAFGSLRVAYSAYMNKRQELFMANGRLAVSIAKKFQRLMPLNDLIHYAVAGLLTAVDGVELGYGAFSSYAYTSMKGTVLTALAKYYREIRIPPKDVGDVVQCNEALQQCSTRGEDLVEELVGLLSTDDDPWSKKRVEEALRLRDLHPQSYNRPMGKNGDEVLARIAGSAEAPVHNQERTETQELCRKMIEDALRKVRRRLEEQISKDTKGKAVVSNPGLAIEMWRMKYLSPQRRNQDIAEEFGLDEETVKKQIHRVHSLFVQIMRQNPEEVIRKIINAT